MNLAALVTEVEKVFGMVLGGEVMAVMGEVMEKLIVGGEPGVFHDPDRGGEAA